MTNFIAIPATLFDEPKYRDATPALKAFLIDLYAQFSDCERFTVDVQSGDNRAMVYRHIRELVDTGLIKVIDLQDRDKRKPQRIFAFAYPSEQAYA